MERDEDVRTACFLSLDVLRAQFGDDLPYDRALSRGFAYRGQRVPFLNYQKGIFRARVQRGPAALSANTSYNSPYDDEETALGFGYAYRSGSIDQPDNKALRAAHTLGAPIVYFIGIRPGWYRPLYPCFVSQDDPTTKHVVISVGTMIGPLDEREPVPLEDPIERRYALRETRIRLHQARFRGRVVLAYRDRCAICRLKELRLLDAAHIVQDTEEAGEALVPNGLSLCSIHHRAFDHDLVGISPDCEVHVARRLLEDDDGPMLDLLKGFDGTQIEVPARKAWRPDRRRLAIRFDRFRSAS